MIEYKTGDMFTENAEAFVNSVNCVGVMGRGIALQFKNNYPDNFKAYAKACERDEVQPGQMFVFETGRLTNPRYIINFPTKRHWRGKSRMEDIESGLEALTKEIRERNIRSIAIPPLGSDLGGLNWNDVSPRIEAMLRDFDGVHAVIFTPGSAPVDGRPNFSTNVPTMTPARAALVALMTRYLGGLLDPFVTLLEVHKLMYFLQVSGEPLRLNYQKAHYGPYAENMRHLLREMDGHLVEGYRDGGDQPDKPLALVPGAIKDADKFLEGCPDTRMRLGQVAHLVEGFESSFGLELLATVHWVATECPTATVDEVIRKTYAWGNRKKQFSERHIRVAYRMLTNKGWLSGSPAGQHPNQ
jgi:O-acetyl-ADP-ribose deacetylase (regulator of RNase III)